MHTILNDGLWFIIGGVVCVILWQFIRHNNKPIADKTDSVTDKVSKL